MVKRLELIYSLIDNDSRGVVDIGTDHGYIPVKLAENGFNGNIFATDVNSQPLEKSVRNAKSANVFEKISFRLCDGLSGMDDCIFDTIIAAGMGGDLICRILDASEICLEKTLILQPMTKQHILRYWLINNGFELVFDGIIYENRRYFQVIKAVPGTSVPYTDAELFLGKDYKYDYQIMKYKEKLSSSLKKKISGLESGALSEESIINLYRNIYLEIKEECDGNKE